MSRDVIFIANIDEHRDVYRDSKTGIAFVQDASIGLGHSCHANIDASGSIRGMKNLGYWKKNARCVRSNGYIYNIDTHIIEDKYDKIAFDYCMCEACVGRKQRKVS